MKMNKIGQKVIYVHLCRVLNSVKYSYLQLEDYYVANYMLIF